MIAYQRAADPKSGVGEQDFMYMFGGILTLTDPPATGTGFQYQGDMWKYNLLSNQWTYIQSYGIKQINRKLYLWNNV